jgi:hypothetical protein
VIEPLPELLDAKRVQAELGVTRAVAEKLMRRLPLVVFEDVRKVYVKREDIARLIEKRTFAKNEVASSVSALDTTATQ